MTKHGIDLAENIIDIFFTKKKEKKIININST